MKHSTVYQCDECRKLELSRMQNGSRYGYYPIKDNLKCTHRRIYKMGILWKWIKRIVAIIIISILIWCIYGAFNGIQPFSDYKDSIQEYISGLLDNQKQDIKIVAREYTLDDAIVIYIEPTKNTMSLGYYDITLYKNGVEIDCKTVAWTQKEISTLYIKWVTFEIPHIDYEVYIWRYLLKEEEIDPFGTIFTVGITETNSIIYREIN
jgi:hypothetical protein